MKPMRDEDLQKLFTEGNAYQKEEPSDRNNQDFHAYRHLFDALETEPEYDISVDFADKLVQKIGWRQTVNVFVRQLLLVAACVVGGFGIGIGTTYFLDATLGVEFLQMANQAKWVVVFGCTLFTIIQFLDKQFVRKPNQNLFSHFS